MEFHPTRASYCCGNPQLWHLIKVRGSSPRLHHMHSPSQTPTIHTYPGLFSLLARYGNLVSVNTPSWYQSISFIMAYPLNDYQHTLLQRPLAILSLSILSTWLNHWSTTSSILSSRPFFTLHNSLIRAFGTLSILLMPSNPLRLSICTALTLDLSFSSYNIVSPPYRRTVTSKSSCKSLALTGDLMALATLLPLAVFLYICYHY